MKGGRSKLIKPWYCRVTLQKWDGSRQFEMIISPKNRKSDQFFWGFPHSLLISGISTDPARNWKTSFFVSPRCYNDSFIGFVKAFADHLPYFAQASKNNAKVPKHRWCWQPQQHYRSNVKMETGKKKHQQLVILQNMATQLTLVTRLHPTHDMCSIHSLRPNATGTW